MKLGQNSVYKNMYPLFRKVIKLKYVRTKICKCYIKNVPHFNLSLKIKWMDK